jgi:hypothetical protein
VLALSITSGVTPVPAEAIGAVVTVVALAVGLAILYAARRAIWRTTLIGPWWWTVAALCAWAAIEMGASIRPEAVAVAPLRLAAVTLSFCPVVALLGAKRPQHLAWNFVVLSLWAIVALPVAESLYIRGVPQPEFGDARGWFLWILVLLGPINFIPTRYWLSSLLVAAGQVLALSPYLVPIRRPLTGEPGLVGLVLCMFGFIAAWIAARRTRDVASGYDRLWLDFRDSFGLFWALRVQERVNAAAKQQGWDVDLAWNGLRRRSDDAPMIDIDPNAKQSLRTTIQGLLRRFVSSDWIAERLGQPPQ